MYLVACADQLGAARNSTLPHYSPLTVLTTDLGPMARGHVPLWRQELGGRRVRVPFGP